MRPPAPGTTARMLPLVLCLSLHAAPPPTASAEPLRLGFQVDVWVDDRQPVNLGLVGGTEHLSLRLFAGAGRAAQFVAGAGVGARAGGTLWAEAGAETLIVQALTGTQPTDLTVTARLHLGVRLNRWLSFFLGPSLNANCSFAPNPVMQVSALAPLWAHTEPSGGGGWQFWAGALAGLRLESLYAPGG